jgi:hypothetical protein
VHKNMDKAHPDYHIFVNGSFTNDARFPKYVTQPHYARSLEEKHHGKVKLIRLHFGLACYVSLPAGSHIVFVRARRGLSPLSQAACAPIVSTVSTA